MNILVLMIPITFLLSAGFLAAFIWVVKSGQYDDTETPAHRILVDENKAEEQST
ncbi:MAG: cbb3-type cytochrome oxidase assembly protein CcoS [Bdellovibrionales bacterium]